MDGNLSKSYSCYLRFIYFLSLKHWCLIQWYPYSGWKSVFSPILLYIFIVFSEHCRKFPNSYKDLMQLESNKMLCNYIIEICKQEYRLIKRNSVSDRDASPDVKRKRKTKIKIKKYPGVLPELNICLFYPEAIKKCPESMLLSCWYRRICVGFTAMCQRALTGLTAISRTLVATSVFTETASMCQVIFILARKYPLTTSLCPGLLNLEWWTNKTQPAASFYVTVQSW